MKALTTFFIMLVCMAMGLFLWLKVFGSKNAERLMKMRLQGPFVPTGVPDSPSKPHFIDRHHPE